MVTPGVTPEIFFWWHNGIKIPKPVLESFLFHCLRISSGVRWHFKFTTRAFSPCPCQFHRRNCYWFWNIFCFSKILFQPHSSILCKHAQVCEELKHNFVAKYKTQEPFLFVYSQPLSPSWATANLILVLFLHMARTVTSVNSQKSVKACSRFSFSACSLL